MNRKFSTLLLLTLWLGACTSSPTAVPAVSTEPAAPAAGSTPTDTSEQTPAGREAVVSDFENEVVVKATADGEFIPAESGFVIQQSGSLQTGSDSRARLDLMPEGTIVRVAPNSAFTLPEITETDGTPKTSIQLFFGKIFVLLNGGSLDVQTPSGVASVRGSLLSVSYDPETGRVQAACLEGHCALENEDGNEVELLEGESGYVDESGEVYEFEGIDRDEVLDWLDEAPELGEFLEELPDPESYYEINEFDDFDFDPATYFEEKSTEDDGFNFFDEEGLPDGGPRDGSGPGDGPGEDPPGDDGGDDDGSGG